MADQDRTEAPTPRRLERARGEGQVPVARSPGPALLLAGLALLVRYIAAPAGGLDLFGGLLRHATDADFGATLHAALAVAARLVLMLAAPVALLGVLAGPVATLAQTRFLLAPVLLRPDFGRISPLGGLSRLFGRANWLGGLTGLAKLGCFAVLLWDLLPYPGPALGRLLVRGPDGLMGLVRVVVADALLAAALVQAAGAGLDLLVTRRRFQRDMGMSRAEIRQESREANGNPEIKARIRRLRAQRARRRMLRDVARATVVVTNPTHYAVALAYDAASGAAPRVVAKGVDDMAARIRAAATAHRVALVASPALARALYRVELEAEIPAELYKAVAELIAYVWRLRRPGRMAA